MIKRTQTNRLSVFDHFEGLALKGLTICLTFFELSFTGTNQILGSNDLTSKFRKTRAIPEPCQTSKILLFAKIVNVNYHRKKLHLRCFAGF